METIKRKIVLDEHISRDEKNWGELKTDAFYVNIFISSDIDDMGLYSDSEFIEYYENLAEPLINITGYSPNTRFIGKNNSDYFEYGNQISAHTEDNLSDVMSYNRNLRFKVNLNIVNENIINYLGETVNSVNRVIENNEDFTSYVIDGVPSEEFFGTTGQTNGLFYNTYKNITRETTDSNGQSFTLPLTELYYKGQGINQTNSSLSAITKEEYLFGITEKPTVFSDLLVDRGINTINQRLLQLGEIKNMEELENYGNGFYNIVR
jgi:hypothetical protein